VFEALSKTLLHLLSKQDKAKAIMACTLRNKETLAGLFQTLGENVQVEQEKCPSKQYFVYANEFPVLIYKLSLLKV